MISVHLVFFCVALVYATLFVHPSTGKTVPYDKVTFSVGRYSEYSGTTQCSNRPNIDTNDFNGISVPQWMAQEVDSICNMEVQVTYNVHGVTSGKPDPQDNATVVRVVDICPSAGCAVETGDPNTILLTAAVYRNLGAGGPPYMTIPVAYNFV